MFLKKKKKTKPRGINTSTFFSSIPSVFCQCFLLAKFYWEPKEKELQLDVLYMLYYTTLSPDI